MATDAPTEAGRIIGGRYRLGEQLGLGGTAAVYRATDLRTGQGLALKRSVASDPRSARRRRAALEREFHTLAQLSHPSIIEVFDFGVDDQVPYYTMELLDGADLDTTGQLPWRDAAALLRDLASSLAMLHARGLLHRDVSATNVRRTQGGLAKLIDFGAMASAGVVGDMLGTPPYVAPEVLQMQPLDARSDLFSLGALGYYVLTGRHAFRARKLSDLRDVWRSRPMPPSRLAPDVPEALSQLILQLLSLDRGVRPRNAAEVIGRLCAIADLPMAELGAVSRAYLFAPTLVGRDGALLEIRKHMLSLLRGEGGGLMIVGPTGSGRSRMLEACSLEAKLLGAQVVRADAADSTGGDWSVARTLVLQLHALFPESSSLASRFSGSVLGQVIDVLRPASGSQPPAAGHERGRLLRELRDYCLAVTRGQRVVMVVDEVERIDEPSAALLAGLLDKLDRHSMLLAVSMDTRAEARAAHSLSLLRALSTPIELPALDYEQTLKLLRSMFGDVERLQLCAARVQRLAEGNPRATVELAQHLVDRGLVRYQAGAWSIVPAIEHSDLPEDLIGSLSARLEPLSADARELAEALALVEEGTPFDLEGYSSLANHGDPRRTFCALQELVSARVLLATSNGYRFSQHGFVRVLANGLREARSVTLHARIADIFERSSKDILRRAHHLLLGGREAEGVRLLCQGDVTELLARLPPIALLDRAVAAAERDSEVPPRALQQLRVALLSKAALLGAIESFRRRLPQTLAVLERDSGLAAYRELTELEPGDRLMQALALQNERYHATPEAQRVYPVQDAISELARLSAAVSAIATVFADLTLLESYPSFEPLLPLSPALAVVEQLMRASRLMVVGNLQAAMESYQAALARVRKDDNAGLEPLMLERVELSVEYVLGVCEASLGLPSAEKRASYIEHSRSMRVAAWRVRTVMQLFQGDLEQSRRSARRAELLQLQDGILSYYNGTTAAFELLGSSQLGDVVGVQAALHAISDWAELHPTWLAVRTFGQACSSELHGDLARALELLRETLALPGVERQLFFGALAAAHIRVLLGLKRDQEALARGAEYLLQAEREGRVPARYSIALELAFAHAAVGQSERAVELLRPGLAYFERIGAIGFALGRFEEALARIALSAGDQTTFRSCIERCALEYRKSGNANLIARVSHLVDQADQQRLLASTLVRELTSTPPERHEAHTDALHARMIECVDKTERASCALSWLLQSVEAERGYLFGVDGDELVLIAGLPEIEVDAGMLPWLKSWLHNTSSVETTQEILPMKLADCGTNAQPDEIGAALTDSERFVDAAGHRYEVYTMASDVSGERRLAALLVLQIAGPRRNPPPLLLTSLASELLEQHDVTGSPV